MLSYQPLTWTIIELTKARKWSDAALAHTLTRPKYLSNRDRSTNCNTMSYHPIAIVTGRRLAGKADPGKTKSDAALAYSSIFDCASSRIRCFNNSVASSSHISSQQSYDDDTIALHCYTILLPRVAWIADQESRRPLTAFSKPLSLDEWRHIRVYCMSPFASFWIYLSDLYTDEYVASIGHCIKDFFAGILKYGSTDSLFTTTILLPCIPPIIEILAP